MRVAELPGTAVRVDVPLVGIAGIIVDGSAGPGSVPSRSPRRFPKSPSAGASPVGAPLREPRLRSPRAPAMSPDATLSTRLVILVFVAAVLMSSMVMFDFTSGATVGSMTAEGSSEPSLRRRLCGRVKPSTATGSGRDGGGGSTRSATDFTASPAEGNVGTSRTGAACAVAGAKTARAGTATPAAAATP